MNSAQTYKYVFGVLAIVILGAAGGWIVYLRATPSFGATITLQPQNFVQSVAVSGTVQAAQNVELGFDQSGRVSGVYAQVGQNVDAGTKLAEIENGDLQAAVTQKEAALLAAQATLASLQSGTRPEAIAITQTQIDNDGNAVAQEKQAVVNAIQVAFTDSDDAVHNKADQLFNNPGSQSPTLDFTTSDSQSQSTLVSARMAIEPVLNTWRTDIAHISTSTTDLTPIESETQSDLAQVSQFLSDANDTLNAGIASQTASSAVLASYTAEVATARSTVNAAQSTLTSAISGLQSAQAALSEDQKNLALQQAGTTSNDIDAQRAVVAEAQANLESAQAQLEQTVVTAPFNGIITQMDAKIGQIVSPSSQEIAMISSGAFQIVCYIPEVEIAGVQVGDHATTTLDAYGAGVSFSATIISVDPAETMVNGVPTYKTTLQFALQDARIKSGMTANVNITTQSVPNAITIPQGAIFTDSQGRQIVQIVRSNKPVDVPVVTSGQSVVGNVQIISGLSAGDVVILSPDTSL